MDRAKLKRYHSLIVEVQYLRDELDTLDNLIKHCQSPALSGMPSAGGGASDKIGRNVAKLCELQHILKHKLDEIDAERIEIEEAINSLEPMERTILRLRYVKCLPWWRIANEVAYSERMVKYIEARAIEKI